jgi:preprotein translocase subunit SecA
LPDVGTEVANIDNDTNLSADQRELKKDELSKIYAERSDRLHTVQQLLKAYGLYEKDVDYVIQ